MKRDVEPEFSGGRKAAKKARQSQFDSRKKGENEAAITAALKKKASETSRHNDLLAESNSLLAFRSVGEGEAEEDKADCLEFIRMKRKMHLAELRKKFAVACGPSVPNAPSQSQPSSGKDDSVVTNVSAEQVATGSSQSGEENARENVREGI